MKFAPFVNIQCREGHHYPTVYRARMDEGVLAEELGFDAFWLAEHAFVEHGRPSPAVSLGHLAARTSRIRLGTAVSVLTWHNPLEVAQDYATVDILSGGRLNFGIGRGGQKHEFDGYGVDWLTSLERYQEAFQIVLKAWEGKPFSFNGRFFEFPELYVNPMPEQRPHPPLFQPTLSPASIAAVVPQNITPIVGASFSSKDRIRDNFAHLTRILESESGPIWTGSPTPTFSWPIPSTKRGATHANPSSGCWRTSRARSTCPRARNTRSNSSGGRE